MSWAIKTAQDLQDWNKKLYPKHFQEKYESSELGAEWLWEHFQIKSAPKFGNGYCWSHIPECWGDDVHQLLTEIRNRFGDDIEFDQIKEKFCELVVYCHSKSKNDTNRAGVRILVQECSDRLKAKGLHP